MLRHSHKFHVISSLAATDSCKESHWFKPCGNAGKGFTQAELARKLGITRSSVNAWEMGISAPSTQYVVELANTFGVSTDYLLCVDKTASLDISGLSEKDVQLLYQIVSHLKEK